MSAEDRVMLFVLLLALGVFPLFALVIRTGQRRSARGASLGSRSHRSSRCRRGWRSLRRCRDIGCGGGSSWSCCSCCRSGGSGTCVLQLLLVFLCERIGLVLSLKITVLDLVGFALAVRRIPGVFRVVGDDNDERPTCRLLCRLEGVILCLRCPAEPCELRKVHRQLRQADVFLLLDVELCLTFGEEFLFYFYFSVCLFFEKETCASPPRV